MQNATDKVGDVMEKDRDKMNYHVCFAGKQIQRLWECKEIPWSCTHSHMCEDSSAVWERSFALETNLQVTSSQDTKPHSQLLLIKKSLFFYRVPSRITDTWKLDWKEWSAGIFGPHLEGPWFMSTFPNGAKH